MKRFVRFVFISVGLTIIAIPVLRSNLPNRAIYWLTQHGGVIIGGASLIAVLTAMGVLSSTQKNNEFRVTSNMERQMSVSAERQIAIESRIANEKQSEIVAYGF